MREMVLTCAEREEKEVLVQIHEHVLRFDTASAKGAREHEFLGRWTRPLSNNFFPGFSVAFFTSSRQ